MSVRSDSDWINPCAEQYAALSPECRDQLRSPRPLITPVTANAVRTVSPILSAQTVIPTTTERVVVNQGSLLTPATERVIVNQTVVPTTTERTLLTPVAERVVVNQTPQTIISPVTTERVVVNQAPQITAERVVVNRTSGLSPVVPVNQTSILTPTVSNQRVVSPVVQLQPTTALSPVRTTPVAVSSPVISSPNTLLSLPPPPTSPLAGPVVTPTTLFSPQPPPLSPLAGLSSLSLNATQQGLLEAQPIYSNPASAPVIVLFDRSASITQTDNSGETWLVARAIPSSIVAFESDNVTVDEVTSVNNVVTSETIIRENLTGLTDYRLVSRIDTQVSKGNMEFLGTLLDRTDKTVTIRDNLDQIEVIRNYDWIKLGNPQQVVVTAKPATISYLSDELSWTPRGVAIINPTTKTVTFTILGDINTTRDIVANVVLANDLLNQVVRHNPVPRMAMLAAAVTESLSQRSIPSKGVGGAPRYSLGLVAIKPNTTAVVSSKTRPVNKLHIVNTSDSQRIQVGYEFITDSYIPAGTVSIYDDKGYSGNTAIEAAEAGEQVILTQGDAVDVRALVRVIKEVQHTPNLQIETLAGPRSLETSLVPGVGLVEVERTETKSRLGWYSITEDIRAEIITEKPLKLLLRHSIDDRVFLQASTLETKPNRNGILEWLLDIPVGTTQINVVVQSAEFRDTL